MSSPFSATICRLAMGGKPAPLPTKRVIIPRSFPPRHGERIWLFNHTIANHVVYSFEESLTPKIVNQQIPFIAKKLKPPKIRYPYWENMAVIEFPKDLGAAGRSVYQKLREFRKRHELEWPEEELGKLDKLERAKELNDQKANSVADIAAVLAGAGKGNLMWEVPNDDANGEPGKLHGATIYWADKLYQAYAEEWSINVRHELGIPHVKDWSKQLQLETGRSRRG